MFNRGQEPATGRGSLEGGEPKVTSRSRSRGKGGGHTHHQYGERARPVGMHLGRAVQRVVRERGRLKLYIEGWPGPISPTARLTLPPIPRHPTYGPDARREVRRLMALAKRKKINLGPWTQASLQRVARGEGPLGYCEWKRVVDYLARVEAQLEAERRRAMPPQLAVRINPGSRPGLRWSVSA